MGIGQQFQVEYPFPANLAPPSDLMRAFPRAEVEPELLLGLLYGFVTGARVNDLTHAKFAYRYEVKPFPEGKWDPVTNMEGANDRSISEVAVRTRFRNWRKFIFTSRARTKLYLKSIERYSIDLRSEPKLWESINTFFEFHGLFNDLSVEERGIRLKFWENANFCIRQCPYGLNTAKFKNKTNGATPYLILLSQWHIFLGEQDGRNSFTKYAWDNRVPCENSNFYISDQLSKKVVCQGCTQKPLNYFDEIMQPCIFSIVAPFRASRAERFYEIFAHAVTIALLRRELSKMLIEQIRNHSSWIILPDRIRNAWVKNLYDIDTNYQKMISSAVHEIVGLHLKYS